MILAGDIGGTNARLAFFDVANGQFRLTSAAVFPSREYKGLDEIVVKFVRDSNLHPQAACFGVAGPVRNGQVRASNLPWVIEASRLAAELDLKEATLINDLEANAWGIAVLDAKDFVPLNQALAQPTGNRAIISAGTGLGEAGMCWDGNRHQIFASEGGHGDFAPRNDLEVELFCYLAKQFDHVSYERVVSGQGLVNIFSFLRDTKRGTPSPALVDEMQQKDPAASISRAAMEGKDSLAEQAMDLFISIYGAEAGNLALKLMSTGGVYLGGGISPKILPKLQGPGFMNAFLDKGRMRGLMESIPVMVITNDQTALLGAARRAALSTR